MHNKQWEKISSKGRSL